MKVIMPKVAIMTMVVLVGAKDIDDDGYDPLMMVVSHFTTINN